MNIESDCSELKETILKKDKISLIKLCANRTNIERQEIKKLYEKIYKIDLISAIENNFSGIYKHTFKSLFSSLIDYDCKSLKKAMKGLITNNETLIEIINTRSNSDLEEIIQKFKELNKEKDLIKKIENKSLGITKKILISILDSIINNNRSENINPNLNECESSARELYNLGEKKWESDSSIFINLFATKSPIEFIYISKFYHKISGHTILDVIEKEFSGDNKKLLKLLLYAKVSPCEYFAIKLNKIIKNIESNKNNKLLIRILITRKEIDLPIIKKYYKLLYKKQLIDDIKQEVEGEFKQFLIEMIGN